MILLSVKMYILRTRTVDYSLLTVCDVMDLAIIFKLQSQTGLYTGGGGGGSGGGPIPYRIQVPPSHF